VSRKAVVTPPLGNPDLLTVKETAAVLRLSVSTIRSWVLLRRIPFVKLHNKAVRFRRADIDALIAASVVPARAA
jgi:excisionase family DNA binding protein